MGLTERFLSPLPLADAAVTVAAPNRFGIKAAAPPLPLSLLLPPLPPLPMLALPLERWPGADAFKEGRMFEGGYFFLPADQGAPPPLLPLPPRPLPLPPRPLPLLAGARASVLRSRAAA